MGSESGGRGPAVFVLFLNGAIQQGRQELPQSKNVVVPLESIREPSSDSGREETQR